MHLRDRRARDRLALERRVELGERPAEAALDLGKREVGRKRWHPVLQLRKLVGDIGRQQIAPRGEHLAKLDEDRPQPLEGLAQPLTARVGAPPGQEAQHEVAGHARHELVQAVADGDGEDAHEAQQPNQGARSAARMCRAPA